VARDGDERLVAAARVAAVASVAVFGLTFGLLASRSSDRSGLALGLSVLGLLSGPLVGGAVWLVGSQLQKATRLAQDSARRLDSAAATGHELVWEIDPDGIVTYMSEVAREMFGIDPSLVVGQSVFVLLPSDDQGRARRLLESSVHQGRGWDGLTFEALHTDGGRRWVETSGIPHVDDDGRLRGFTATTRQLDSGALQRLTLDSTRERLRRVLDDKLLSTVFQPIVDVGSGRVVGHEALTRFSAAPVQGPDRWFAEAEQVGLGAELDVLAVQTALFAAQRLPRHGYVSVNVTPATLQSALLAQLVETAPIAGDRIVLELTEHVSVEDYQTFRVPLERLRALGVRLAVDDAGAGYASFRHILRLRPEFIKLDQEIIRGIEADPARRALAAAVVMFSLDVGATVIAEGVETAPELCMVANLGIEAAQGYLLGRPSADPQDWGRSHQPRMARRRQADRVTGS
jgi:PAS domain S-box-containing protein